MLSVPSALQACNFLQQLHQQTHLQRSLPFLSNPYDSLRILIIPSCTQVHVSTSGNAKTQTASFEYTVEQTYGFMVYGHQNVWISYHIASAIFYFRVYFTISCQGLSVGKPTDSNMSTDQDTYAHVTLMFTDNTGSLIINR